MGWKPRPFPHRSPVLICCNEITQRLSQTVCPISSLRITDLLLHRILAHGHSTVWLMASAPRRPSGTFAVPITAILTAAQRIIQMCSLGRWQREQALGLRSRALWGSPRTSSEPLTGERRTGGCSRNWSLDRPPRWLSERPGESLSGSSSRSWGILGQTRCWLSGETWPPILPG